MSGMEDVAAAFEFVAEYVLLCSRGWRPVLLVDQYRTALPVGFGAASVAANARVFGWVHPFARQAMNMGPPTDFFEHDCALGFEDQVLASLFGTDVTMRVNHVWSGILWPTNAWCAWDPIPGVPW